VQSACVFHSFKAHGARRLDIAHTRTIIYGVVCAGVSTPAIGSVRTIAYLYYYNNIRGARARYKGAG